MGRPPDEASKHMTNRLFDAGFISHTPILSEMPQNRMQTGESNMRLILQSRAVRK